MRRIPCVRCGRRAMVLSFFSAPVCVLCADREMTMALWLLGCLGLVLLLTVCIRLIMAGMLW